MSHAHQASSSAFQRFDPGPILDESQSDGEVTMMDGIENLGEKRDGLIIAVDFGTTFSSVAYARITGNIRPEQLGLDSILCVKDYPDQPLVMQMPPREDVPTELWYKVHRKQAQLQHAPDVIMEDHREESGSDDPFEFPSSDDGSDLEQEQPDGMHSSRLDSIFWGFGVQRHLKEIDIPKDDHKRLARFKLMLDYSPETEEVRTELAPILKNLKRSKLIHRDADAITDYLEFLLKHTKSQLQLYGVYDDSTAVEFVLCVPGVWPVRARQIMQESMAIAVQRAAIGRLVHDSFDNLFIVSEPEAAAACVIEEDEETIYTNETIVIVDAGGGTIDVATYQVDNSQPLRLRKEVVKPSTKLCGSSYINERFAMLLNRKLKHEAYLEKNGKTIKSIVESKTIEFENGQKRIIDIADKNFRLEPVYIDDLKPNLHKHFFQNRLNISKKELRWMFEVSLDGAAKMLREQLELAKAENHSVQKVILIGGFGQSPALRSHLRDVVASERNYLDQEINFLTPSLSSTVVARGAVLRALDKARGPRRVTDCSYGFLHTEIYDPEGIPAHKQTKCRTDPVDGEKYIHNTILWLILKGEELPYHKEFPLEVVHCFALTKRRLLCEEQVYMSDDRLESHYRVTHAKNKGAELKGSIKVDMTFLRDKGYIQPTEPSKSSANYGKPQKSYWEVQFDLVMILDGRNLRYEARWPPKRKLQDFGETHQVVQESGQICVAAAFAPGTA